MTENLQRAGSILIVDDDPEFRELLTAWISSFGYLAVPPASSGAEGIASVRKRRPGLVLMDVNMPGEIDGIDAAEVIQRLFHVPVVLLTGRSDDGAVSKALEKRVFGYIVKPVNQQALATALEIAFFNFLMDSERSSDMTIGIDSDRRLIYLSRNAERSLGYSSEALEGSSLEDLIAPPSRKTLDLMISKTLDPEKPVEIEVVKAGNSERVWLELKCREIRTQSGSAGVTEGYQLTGHDITPRRDIEQRLLAASIAKDILLQEVHHRFRNHLQGISGLLKSDAARLAMNDSTVQPLEVFRSAQARLSAMQALHDELFLSKNQTNVHMRGYIDRLVLAVAETYGVQREVIEFVKHVADVVLNVDTASPCGLLISELLTNSVKHGFPAGHHGRITIRLVENATGEITLTVTDNGVGFDTSDGLATNRGGLSIIQGLAMQLRGAAVLSGQDGLHFCLTFRELRFKQHRVSENGTTRS